MKVKWLAAKYPGDPVRIERLKNDREAGDVRIQDYGDGKYRVGTFLPGVDVFLPGDTPKVEPESCIWTTSVDDANSIFDDYVEKAIADGWRRG